MLRTTVGQLLVNEALPEPLRDYNRPLDKKSLEALLQQVGEQFPDRYREVSKRLSDVGRDVAYSSGGYSFGPESLRQSLAGRRAKAEIEKQLKAIYASGMSPAERRDAVVAAVRAGQPQLVAAVGEEARQTDNPLAHQLRGAGRGNEFQLNSLLGADLMYADHKGRDVPIPVLRSYAQGLRPAEYFAGAFGARKGVIDLKTATQDAGFFAKQLVQAAHRLRVVAADDDEPTDLATPRGLPVDTDDSDNVGARLAYPTGGYARNTLLTPRILKELKAAGHAKLLVRSPTVGGPAEGVYAYDAGQRERGPVSPVGDFAGIAAAQALAEPVTQSQISSKHCLAAGTLVRMADWSVKRIEDIQVGDMVLGADMQANTFPTAVVRTYANGPRDCVTTVFRVPYSRSGRQLELTSTRDHRVLMFRRVSGAKAETDNWTPQLLPVGTPTGRLAAVMPRGFTDNDAGLRAEPFALLAGLLLGDGCYTRAVASVNFSCFDDSLVADVQPLLSPLNLKLHRLKGHRGYYKVSMLSDTGGGRDPVTGQTLPGFRNPIRQWLHARGMLNKYAHEKTLPPDVATWDNAAVAALIAGYFVTDGSVFVPGVNAHRSRPHVCFGSTSQPLVAQVQQLLSQRFGVYSSGPFSSTTGRKRPVHQIVISTEEGIRQFYAAIPLYGVKRRAFALVMSQWVTESPRPFTRYPRGDATDAGIRETYDIEVAHDAHLFVLANGLIVSNSGGVAGASAGAISGFKYINSLVQVPETFRGGAAHAQLDGRVRAIRKAPQGGHYVTVGDQEHYVGRDYALKVAVGDEVEAGDVLSEGIPNPAEVVAHKGIGDGREYFVRAFRQALRNSNTYGNRRNIELVARGLINHVRLTDELGDWAPDDVVPYQSLEREWQPRPGNAQMAPTAAVGRYLERPVLHYTIGTKVRPSMLPQLSAFGVRQLTVHPEPPPFQPEMIRGMANVAHDPDWMTRMLGSYQSKSLRRGVHRGDVSDVNSTSYVPALASGSPLAGVNWDTLADPIPAAK